MMSLSRRPYGKTALHGSMFILVACVAIVIATTPVSAADIGNKELVTVGHEVKSGETLTTIAYLYIQPELRGNERALLEFREGIYELNYDKVFNGRPPYEVRKGDFLAIQFWAVVDYD